jgi:hypothetical protein
MADEERKEESQEQTPEEQTAVPPPQAEGQQQIKINFEGVQPEYANFCTLSVRQGEVFMSFGKAFVPAKELKIDRQIVMSLRNVQQLHQALTNLLKQVAERQQPAQ